MKNSRISLLMLFVGFLVSYQPMAAAWGASGDCCEPKCCESVYDCGDPLNCGSVNLMVRIGAAPTLWRDRGNLSLVSCNALAIPDYGQDIVNVFQLPKFSKLFGTPWIVGGQLGYAVTNNVEFYLEFNYRQAKDRIYEVSGVNLPNEPDLNVTLVTNNKYKVFDAYIGARYYWGRCWCDRFAFFLGGQFGLVRRKAVNFSLNINSVPCAVEGPLNTANCTPLFFKSTSPASGLNVGLDWCVGCGFSFVVMAEFIATCGPRTNSNIVLTNNCTQLPGLLPSNIIVGGIGTELFFPVTVGLKYSF